MVVEVEFEYEAQQSDELTIHVGDIIRNCKPVENGWLEGELNGKRGLFPENFVVKLETTFPSPGMYVHTYMCIYPYDHIIAKLISAWQIVSQRVLLYSNTHRQLQ